MAEITAALVKDLRERTGAHGTPHLTLTFAVDLANDRVVPDIFLDRVFELRAHAATLSRSTTRSLALRLRGFKRNSSGEGTTGFLVTTTNGGEKAFCSKGFSSSSSSNQFLVL